jgi:chromosome segregation protein
MLKALELSGFKSFADKTRFEFPPGITVVVGPNGSGKSNIVDAIKWVLGEQSAKSLRGKDMSDVIFKGSSGANARKPAGAASATLILENADGRLMFDSPEVHVTRRVYRSGESEYLINGQPCRLKDIRNLFRGTGVGTDAYSLIEQGKVDRLLQAGAKDRRAIFEEAAGISRFKAKKIEAERRLERVEANLTRLADIVEEVGNRYRSIKSQAAKAARYREHTQRLQQLRTYVGVKDYRSFSEKLDANAGQLDQLRESAGQLQQSISDLQTRSGDFETRLDASAAEVTRLQELVGNTREAIAQAESNAELNRRRRADVQQRQQQLSDQLTRLLARRIELENALSASQNELQSATQATEQANAQLLELTGHLETIGTDLLEGQKTVEDSRKRQQEAQTQASELSLQVANATKQLETNRGIQAKWADEVTRLNGEIAEQAKQLGALQERKAAAEQRAAENDTALQETNQLVESLEGQLGQEQQNLAELRTKFAGVSVDAALGQIAQFVVVSGNHLQNELAAGQVAVSGRVTLISTDQKLNLQVDPQLDLSDEPEVIGPVLELVQIPERHGDFVNTLLAGTWIVSNLAAGLNLRSRYPGRARFVTLDGEVIESDGTLVVGPKSAAAGIVSRRSELRALNAEQGDLKSQISEAETNVQRLKKDLQSRQADAKKLLGQNQALTSELNEITAQGETIGFQTRTLQSQQSKAATEQQATTNLIAELETQLEADKRSLATLEKNSERLSKELSEVIARISQLEQARREHEQQLTSAKVALAKAEQQLLTFESTNQTHQSNLTECVTTLTQIQSQAGEDESAIKEAERILEQSGKQLQELSQEREKLAEELNQLLSERSGIESQRKELAEQLRKQRSEQRSVEERLNDCTVRARQLTLEREQLALRLKEDYGLEVEQLLGEETPEQAESREEIDREITELRQKIGAIGAVNMQALAELEDLEQRYQTLDQQYQDLSAAKESLLKIIHRINNDSRRLFVETLEAIRGNFQKLFRQTFGGGQADIVLEEGVDVLEAGVEIIATPPGKPKFSNSLLSGGEKALTAVSLLMAIFQFRPSPFCVLDEVDAPFDEANIGRFIDVLKSFLGWTKFVIVTHSKKTMTAATTLYGITMQESGVSKRVSVRFEDVSEDGRISEDAVRRSERETTESAKDTEGEDKSAVA